MENKDNRNLEEELDTASEAKAGEEMAETAETAEEPAEAAEETAEDAEEASEDTSSKGGFFGKKKRMKQNGMEVLTCGLGCEYLQGFSWPRWVTSVSRARRQLLRGFCRKEICFQYLHSTNKTPSLTIFRDGELVSLGTE